MQYPNKNICVVLVYDRIENITLWLRAWKASQTQGWELRIINNRDAKNSEVANQIKSLCDAAGIVYIPRDNIGQDIGALQDVCRGRLEGFGNSFDYMTWCTDDTIPMRPTFLTECLHALWGGHVASVYEISHEVTEHIRTTGVTMLQHQWARLQFPADPMVELHQNYYFEHKGGPDTMLHQLRAMQMNVAQIAPLDKSPFWDVDKRAFLARWPEFHDAFPMTKKVFVIAPIYNTFPEIVSSMICQTHTNWELELIQDGACHTGLGKVLATIGDSRIRYIEWPDRLQQWGHPHRKRILEEIKDRTDIDYVLITNADNYHVPVYFEYMLKPFANPDIVATYCENSVHSYMPTRPDSPFRWGILPGKLERGGIDCAAVIVRKDVACEIGWPNMTHSSDWDYFQAIINKYGAENWAKVEGALLVHN